MGGDSRSIDMRRSLLALLALLLLAAALLPGAAGAADTQAPKGARLDWLPADEWVMSAWLPFDEARLDAIVKTDHAELTTWLNDHRTLLQLARKHGVAGTATALAHRLVAPRLSHVRASMRPVLQRRARDVLTQAHLSRHMLFHVFHTPAIPDGAKSIFGMSPTRFRRLRDSGRSPVAIGAIGGRSAVHVQGALWALLRTRSHRAVALGAMSQAQAEALLAEQKDQLYLYVNRAFRTPEQQVAFLCRAH
jgi:hypothetical protein